MTANKPEDALDLLQDALKITDELTDKRARRAVLRVTVRSIILSVKHTTYSRVLHIELQ